MLIPKVEIRILKYKLKYSLITINSLYEFLNLQKKLTDLQSTQNIRQTSPTWCVAPATRPVSQHSARGRYNRCHVSRPSVLSEQRCLP
jgi:hypothetical protein